MNWCQFRFTIIEELALEGLEGCTFAHLWSLINSSLPYSINQDEQIQFKSYIWKVLTSCPCVEFYELNSSTTTDDETSTIIIEEDGGKCRGFSPSYYRRTNITDSIRLNCLTYKQVEDRLDNIQLVIEQSVRELRITQGKHDVKNLLSKNEYALLECICKARKAGVPTSGNNGLSKLFGINSKSLFYFVKQLLALTLIKKLNMIRHPGSTLKQPVLIMTRYLSIVDIKNAESSIYDKVKLYLQEQVGTSCERNQLKAYLNLGEKSFRALMLRCKRFKIVEKYKQSKQIAQNSRMKSFTYFRIRDPANARDGENEDNDSSDGVEELDETVEEEKIEEELVQDDEDDYPVSDTSKQLFQDPNIQLRLYVDRPIHFQLYELLEAVKDVGLSQRDIATICHLPFYLARSEIKALSKNTRHLAIKAVQINEKGKTMENRVVMKNYMRMAPSVTTTTNTSFIKPTTPKKEPLSRVSTSKKSSSSSSSKKNSNKRKQTEESTIKTTPTKSKKINVTNQNSSLQSVSSSIALNQNDSPSISSSNTSSTTTIKSEPKLPRVKPSIKTVSSTTSSRITVEPSSKGKKSKSRPKVLVKKIDLKREKRLEWIRTYVREHRICTIIELRHDMLLSEIEQGLTTSMDRKTLYKLIDELEFSDNQKCLYRFPSELKQSRTVVCIATTELMLDSPEVKQFKSELLQETIENPTKNSTSTSIKEDQDENESVQSFETLEHPNGADEREKLAQIKSQKLEYINCQGNCYGYVYKFQRCAILHKFLFYLLYAYEGNATQTTNDTDDSFRCDPLLDVQQCSSDPEIQLLLSRIPYSRFYHSMGSNDSITWKTFVPPISTRKGHGEIPRGCFYVDDLLMCMPVSIFLSIIHVPYKVPGLMELLSHSSKRHILIKDLPIEMKYPLIAKRCYLTRLGEILKYLSTFGLITYVGRTQAQNRHEKLNSLCYFHPTACLTNTINQQTNLNGPFEDIDNLYPKQIYYFNSFSNVNRFWFDLIEIALNTYHVKIHTRKQSRSHLIELMKLAAQPIVYTDITELKSPLGSCNGPCGYDYDLYLFLRKSWKLPYSNKRTLMNKVVGQQCFVPVCELRVPVDVALKRSYTTQKTQKRKPKQQQLNGQLDSDDDDEKELTKRRKKIKLSNGGETEIDDKLPVEYYGYLCRYIIPHNLLAQLKLLKKRKKLLLDQQRMKTKQILNRYKIIIRTNLGMMEQDEKSGEATVTTKKNKRKGVKSYDDDEDYIDENEEEHHQTLLRVRWSPIEERVICIINTALRFYNPKRSTTTSVTAAISSKAPPKFDTSNTSVDWILTEHENGSNNTSSVNRRSPTFLPFSKELLYSCLIRCLPGSARSKTTVNCLRKIRNSDLSQHQLIETLTLLCLTDKYLQFYRQQHMPMKRRYPVERRVTQMIEQYFLCLFEQIYLKFKYFIKTGFIDCIPQGTIERLPQTKKELFEKYTCIGRRQQQSTNDQIMKDYSSTTNRSILESTICMAIHSSLLSSSDRTSNSTILKSFLFHNIFSQYPESLLNEVVHRLMYRDACITLTKSHDIQRKISNEMSTFLAGRAYHINQRYIYRWYTYIPPNVLHESHDWLFQKLIHLDQEKENEEILIDADVQNCVAIVSSFVNLFDSQYFQLYVQLPPSFANDDEENDPSATEEAEDDKKEMLDLRRKLRRNVKLNKLDFDDGGTKTEDDSDEDEEDYFDENETEVSESFEKVLASARMIDQNRYEATPITTQKQQASASILKRSYSMLEDEDVSDEQQNTTIKKNKTTTNDNDVIDTLSSHSKTSTQLQLPPNFSCQICQKSFTSHFSLNRHLTRQHLQHEIKASSTTNSLRPCSTIINNISRKIRPHSQDTL
ncbi:unnamed protein product, partial [Didymodactylos carnosus]